MVAQRTLTPYVEVRILLPLPKRSKCQPVLASFLFYQKGFEPVKVSAFGKCAGGTFSAESARAVPHAKRGVTRAYSLQAQRRRRSSLLPLPKRSKCQSVLASFLFQFKRIRASKVSAYRKCAGGTFSAESARAVPHAKRGVSRAYSPQAQRRRPHSVSSPYPGKSLLPALARSPQLRDILSRSPAPCGASPAGVSLFGRSFCFQGAVHR